MRKALVAASVVFMLAGLVWAAGRPGVVRTKDGGLYDGTVEETDDAVTVNVRGITTKIPRERVQTIAYGDFETRWNEQYAKLAKDDVDGRVAMARRAFDERQYDLTEKALRDALAIDANDSAAAELLKLTISQRRLERSATPPAGGTTGSATGTTPAAKSQWKTLTPEQVNEVKQREIQERDTKVKFAFKNNVAKKYYDSKPSVARNYSEFIKLPMTSRAMMIINDGGDMAKDVEVTNDPDVMVVYKRDVQSLILPGCSSVQCHGGGQEAAKKFALIAPAPDTASAYTNFYVIQTTKKNVSSGVTDAMFNPAFATMIDRTQADQSLLLQYGLPEQVADHKHPHVRGYNGIFRGKDDPKYIAIRSFITSLNPVPPEYSFSFTLQRQGEGVESLVPTSMPSVPPAVKDAVQGAKDMLK